MKKDVKDVKIGENVFTELNGSHLKAKILAVEGNDLQLELADGTKFKDNVEFLEFPRSLSQKFSEADAKKKLEGAYVSWDRLSEVAKNDILEGKEILYENRYLKENEEGVKVPNQIVKRVQMLYNAEKQSTMVRYQTRNTKELVLEGKVVFNHEITKEEAKKLKKGETILFEGNSNDGEVFEKIGYVDEKLNDLRTKGALSTRTKFYGQHLTQKQADIINKGGKTEITIDTKSGKKTYEVSFDFKRNNFLTTKVDREKRKGVSVNGAAEIGKTEKKNKSMNQSTKKGTALSM